MVYYAFVFLVIAIIAAVFDFGGINGAAAGISYALFLVFFGLLIVSLAIGLMRSVTRSQLPQAIRRYWSASTLGCMRW